jgi:hypothetical protein
MAAADVEALAYDAGVGIDNDGTDHRVWLGKMLSATGKL